jgi:hypothetical protein
MNPDPKGYANPHEVFDLLLQLGSLFREACVNLRKA